MRLCLHNPPSVLWHHYKANADNSSTDARTMPTLEALALKKPGQEKVSSFMEDSAQPPTMGSSDAHTASGGYACPSSGADSSTENTWRCGKLARLATQAVLRLR